MKTQAEALLEVAQKWCPQNIEVAELLADHLHRHGVIVPVPSDGKELAAIAYEAFYDDERCDWRGCVHQANWRNCVNAVLAAAGQPQVEPDATVEQMVRDVLENAIESDVVELTEDVGADDPQSLTAGDLCGPANVLSKHLKNVEDRVRAKLLQPPKHIKGTTLGEILFVSNGGTASVYQSMPHDSPSKIGYENQAKQLYAAFALAPQPEPPKPQSAAEVLAKMPKLHREYRHKESIYKVLNVYERHMDGEFLGQWVDYQDTITGRTFGCPVSEWIDSGSYQLVEGE